MTHHRTIDVSHLDPVTPQTQAAPQLQWVAIADLVIDTRYQRPLAPGNISAIKRIAADFRWSRFSPLLLAPIEGGLYAVIDGQHRAHSAALCGFKTVPAMITLVPPEEQALAFIEINTRQIRVRSNNIYRAAFIAGEDWAIRCDRAVANAGCALMSVNASTATKKPGQVYAVMLIKSLIDKGQDQAVTSGLQALIDYDPLAVANFSDALLDPWLRAVAESGQVDAETLKRSLSQVRPWIVIERANARAKANGTPLAQTRRIAFLEIIQGHSKSTAGSK